MSENVRQTQQERFCAWIRDMHEQDTTSDETGPQNGPEWTGDMNSIDNLREYVCSAPMSSMTNMARAIVVGMTDEIEREVAELRDREYRNGMEDGEMAAERDGWVRLPVDADGVPIHVGDVMDSKVDYLFDGKPFTVRGLVLCEDGWEAADGRFGNRYDIGSLRHHHAPTVEDVLDEFANAVLGCGVTEDEVQRVISEYAAKFRLASNEE